MNATIETEWNNSSKQYLLIQYATSYNPHMMMMHITALAYNKTDNVDSYIFYYPSGGTFINGRVFEYGSKSILPSYLYYSKTNELRKYVVISIPENLRAFTPFTIEINCSDNIKGRKVVYAQASFITQGELDSLISTGDISSTGSATMSTSTFSLSYYISNVNDFINFGVRRLYLSSNDREHKYMIGCSERFSVLYRVGYATTHAYGILYCTDSAIKNCILYDDDSTAYRVTFEFVNRNNIYAYTAQFSGLLMICFSQGYLSYTDIRS